MTRHILFAIIILMGAAMLPAAAQSVAENQTTDIVGHIEEAGKITIVIPETLRQRLSFSAAETQAEAEQIAAAHQASTKTGGYRIQVFSDNNMHTAKNEARARARNINAQFPEMATYVVYSAPFWRLRVGNFRTHDEASIAAEHLKDAFPAYSKEIRVVRDRIVTSAE